MPRGGCAAALRALALLACVAAAACYHTSPPPPPDMDSKMAFAALGLAVSPQLSFSREGGVKTFKATEDVLWGVTLDRGSASYTLLSYTTRTLSVRAGHTGGGSFSVVARLNATTCATISATAAEAAGATCSVAAAWHITSGPEARPAPRFRLAPSLGVSPDLSAHVNMCRR